MDRYEIQKLRDLPIEAVAERLGLKVVRHRCRCCFHDDHTPSMSFSPTRNTFRCWACEAHGDNITLAMQVLGKGFIDTCRWLADEHNVIISEYKPLSQKEPTRTFDASRYARYFEHPWLSQEACRFLFDVRKLDREVVRDCRLNSYRDCLQIPYYDTQGRLVGLQRRYMGNDPTKPRFMFNRGEECHLYNQQIIPTLRPDEPIYFGEGPSDVWALLSSKRKAVGIPSATLLRTDDLAPFAGRECHVYPDADTAGNALYHKLLSAANDIGFCLIRHDLPEGCKDFSDYWMRTKALPVTRST